MQRSKRTAADKLHTLFFGKDLRVTEGDVFSEIYDGDFSPYFPKTDYISEQTPQGKRFDIRDFGAEANPDFDSTQAVQNAIDACSEHTDGTVVVAGGSYTVHTVHLKSNMTFFIADGAALVACHDSTSYDKEALLYAEGCENLTVTGGGKICGEGNFFGLKPVAPPTAEPAAVSDAIAMRREYRKRIRFPHMRKYGMLCTFLSCKNIHIHNLILENAACWTLNIRNCTAVQLHNLMIHNNRHVANSDGIDLVGSSDVELFDTFISTGDDGICLKNAVWLDCTEDMQNIHIHDCTVITRTNALKIGTETTFDIHHVLVERCKFFMPDLKPGSVSGISVEACDGARVFDITIRDITMDNITCPLFIRLGNRNRAALVDANTAKATEMKVDETAAVCTSGKHTFDFKSEIRNITVENITAQNIELPVIIAGMRQLGKGTKYVENITLRNFDFFYRPCIEIEDRRMFIPEYVKEYPESWRFRNLPAYRLFARHVKNLRIQNFRCSPTPGSWKKAEYKKDVL